MPISRKSLLEEQTKKHREQENIYTDKKNKRRNIDIKKRAEQRTLEENQETRKGCATSDGSYTGAHRRLLFVSCIVAGGDGRHLRLARHNKVAR